MQLQAEADAAHMKLKMKGKTWDMITFACPLAQVVGDTGLTALFVCVLVFMVLQSGKDIGSDFTYAFVNALTAGVVLENGRTRQRNQTETRLIVDWIESTAVVKTVRGDISLRAGDSSQMSKYFNETARKYGTGVSNPEDFQGEVEKFRRGGEEWYQTCLSTRPSRALLGAKEHNLVMGGIAAKRGDSIFIPAGS
jgi:hypothetical protein